MNGNTFGYYFTGTIDKLNDYIKSSNCFIFSLKSNGRLNGMKKFEEKENCKGLVIDDETSSCLFGIHGGFWIYKDCRKTNSNVSEQNVYFDYHRLSNIYLTRSAGQSDMEFTPNRITVIQMN